MERRDFLKTVAAATLVVAAGGLAGLAGEAHAAEAFPMPALPYPENALEPAISAKTISFHYGKHTAAYYAKLNEFAAAKAELQGKTLEQIVALSEKDPAMEAVFNNAAQSWNHTFYWKCMKPGGGGEPAGKLKDALAAAFGSVEAFKKTFAEAGVGQFGSGWAWLVADGGKLAVVKTPNAANPMTKGQKPLLLMDVWEHAYYLDYQNKRAAYIDAFLASCVNWDFVSANLP